MKKLVARGACILALAMCLGSIASAEGAYAPAGNSYDSLCKAASLDSADVIAWVEIPGADFCQPILQHAGDDAFYSTHDAYGAETEGRALYTQKAYNAADFSDPVTVVYGSSSQAGMVFRDLQETYSGRFDECRTILLHLPNETLEYEVFAATPYSAIHILHYYDFTVERRFTSFFDSVYSTRALGMHLAEEDQPEPGEKVVIFSTGLRGDPMQRYLVMAKLVNE